MDEEKPPMRHIVYGTSVNSIFLKKSVKSRLYLPLLQSMLCPTRYMCDEKDNANFQFTRLQVI